MISFADLVFSMTLAIAMGCEIISLSTISLLLTSALGYVLHTTSWFRRKASAEAFSNSAAFVTGCDSGIGRDIVLELLREGVGVVFAGVLSAAAGDQLKRDVAGLLNRGNKAQEQQLLHPCVCDVTKIDDVTKTFVDIKRVCAETGTSLRVVVNNAGVTAFGFAETLPLERFRINMEVHWGDTKSGVCTGTIRQT